MIIRTLIFVALVASVIAGCGRRGSLEAAGEPETTLAPGAGSASYTLDATSPGAQEPEAEQSPAPQRRFFLDFLLSGRTCTISCIAMACSMPRTCRYRRSLDRSARPSIAIPRQR
jgi:hypothetical protein